MGEITFRRSDTGATTTVHGARGKKWAKAKAIVQFGLRAEQVDSARVVQSGQVIGKLKRHKPPKSRHSKAARWERETSRTQTSGFGASYRW